MARPMFLEWNEPEDPASLAAFMVQTWARATVDGVDRAVADRSRHDQLLRQAEYGEDWSPDDSQIERQFQTFWVTQTQAVSAADHLERWLTRYADEVGQESDPLDPMLRTLRNSLEHLDRAALADGFAAPDAHGAWSLARLPGGRLHIGTTGDDRLFGVLDPTALRAAALEVLAEFYPGWGA